MKNPVQRLVYNNYVAHHYAYMAKVVQDVEPTCFDEAVGNVNWEKAMDEEMAAFCMEMKHGIWCHCLKARRPLDASGCTR